VDHGSLWNAIRSRVHPELTDTVRSDYEATDKTVLRMIRCTDISPLSGYLILGSTPNANLSAVARYRERYLSFVNYGNVSLFSLRNPSQKPNAFIFEYHFSFYFITQSISTTCIRDPRCIRRSAPFSPRIHEEKTRFVHEEQLSFLLCGNGSDIYPCCQLAEKYFSRKGTAGVGANSLFVNPAHTRLAAWTPQIASWTPTSIFLSWLMLALHHVHCRWQEAIDSIDAQIDSPPQFIFTSASNPNLVSDDPYFTHSETYFRALQGYKLFDEALTSIVSTWDEFASNSLPKLNDGVSLTVDDWASITAFLTNAIDMLRAKQRHVRKKSEEVQNLRDGLFGASSLFDSRTTVRQGDNIRLLTYVTILFLPLSFCTSIFGMQTVLPSTLSVKIFAITMPAIAVFTAFLVLNMQSLTTGFDKTADALTSRLRRVMEKQGREGWGGIAAALERDRHAREVPVKKWQRELTRWAYVLFVVEWTLVMLPVGEIRWARKKLENMRLWVLGTEGNGNGNGFAELGDVSNYTVEGASGKNRARATSKMHRLNREAMSRAKKVQEQAKMEQE
jgi:hypothetical protein